MEHQALEEQDIEFELLRLVLVIFFIAILFTVCFFFVVLRLLFAFFLELLDQL